MATIRKRGKSYQIRVSDGYDVRGNQKVRTMTWTPDEKMSEKQIEKELNRQAVLFEDKVKSQQIANKNIKFEAFAKQWFKEYAEIHLKPRTLAEMYKREERVYDAIGHLRIDRITKYQISTFINSLAEPGVNKRTGGGLSSKSRINYLNFISDVLEYAVDLQIISENPARGIKIKRDDKSEKKIYTLDQTQYFIDHLDGVQLQFQLMCLLAIFGGFRLEELLGFEWKDLDFENSLISVRRVSLYAKGRGVFTDTPKTKTSLRTSKLPNDLMQKLKSLRIWQLEQRLALGDQWVDSDRLFIGWDGKPLHPNSPCKQLQNYCKRIGLPCYGMHSFRHLHASILIANGIDVQTVSSDLGHAQTSTTLNIYTHAFAEAKAKVSETLSNTLSITKTKVK